MPSSYATFTGCGSLQKRLLCKDHGKDSAGSTGYGRRAIGNASDVVVSPHCLWNYRTHDMKKIIYWFPRILTLSFAIFISLFAMDVWSGEESFFLKLAGFMIHLIPTFAILVILAFAWRREWIGGAAFILLGGFYMIVSGMREHWAAYVSISGTLFVTGILFCIGWFKRKASGDRQ